MDKLPRNLRLHWSLARVVPSNDLTREFMSLSASCPFAPPAVNKNVRNVPGYTAFVGWYLFANMFRFVLSMVLRAGEATFSLTILRKVRW